MISILFMTLLLSFVKLLSEEDLLLILMTMEMISMISFFAVLQVNPEALSLSSCTVTMLTVLISESVLSLTIFISLMRGSKQESVLSMSLSR